jgi:hypothetical protein
VFSSLISSLCILKCDRLSISILYFTSNWCFNILWMCSFQHPLRGVSSALSSSFVPDIGGIIGRGVWRLVGIMFGTL